MKALLYQLVSRFQQLDPATINDIFDPLSGVAATIPYLNLYEVNQWLIARQHSKNAEITDNSPKCSENWVDWDAQPADENHHLYYEGLKKLDILAEDRIRKDGKKDKDAGAWMPSVDPFTGSWKAWFDWRNEHHLGTCYMLRRAFDGKGYTVPELTPPAQ